MEGGREALSRAETISDRADRGEGLMARGRQCGRGVGVRHREDYSCTGITHIA